MVLFSQLHYQKVLNRNSVAMKSGTRSPSTFDLSQGPGFTLEATQGQIGVFLSQLIYRCHRIGWHLWEIDFRFANGLPPGWLGFRVQVAFDLRGWLQGRA